MRRQVLDATAVGQRAIADAGRSSSTIMSQFAGEMRRASFETPAEPVLGPRVARTRGRAPQDDDFRSLIKYFVILRSARQGASRRTHNADARQAATPTAVASAARYAAAKRDGLLRQSASAPAHTGPEPWRSWMRCTTQAHTSRPGMLLRSIISLSRSTAARAACGPC